MSSKNYDDRRKDGDWRTRSKGGDGQHGDRGKQSHSWGGPRSGGGRGSGNWQNRSVGGFGRTGSSWKFGDNKRRRYTSPKPENQSGYNLHHSSSKYRRASEDEGGRDRGDVHGQSDVSREQDHDDVRHRVVRDEDPESVDGIKNSIEKLNAKLEVKEKEEAKANPIGHLQGRIRDLEEELGEEKSKSEMKRCTFVQNRSLIEKNKTLYLEINEMKDKGLDGCVCIGKDVPKLEVNLAEALVREQKLITDITKVTAGRDEFEQSRCEKCESAEKTITHLRRMEDNFNKENEDLLKQLEDTLDDKEKLNARFDKERKELKELKLRITEEGLLVNFNKVNDENAKLEEELGNVRTENDELKMRLEKFSGEGMEDLVTDASIELVLKQMGEGTKSFFASFHEKAFTDVEKFRLVLCMANGLMPAARFTVYKFLLTADTSAQRDCVEKLLNKLCTADREQKVLVKEISVKGQQSSNENTPSDSKKVIIPDESLVGMDIDRYRNKFNAGCKTIRYPGLILLAANKGRHVIKKHSLFVDASGKSMAGAQSCPIASCKKAYVVGVTEIAPMSIVGPVTHGRLGKTIWPCVEHWRESLENSSDDEFMETTGIVVEAAQFEKKAGIRRLSRTKRTSPAARRSLIKEVEDLHDAVSIKTVKGATEAFAKVVAKNAGKKNSAADSMKDIFDDSQQSIEFLGPSDEEK